MLCYAWWKKTQNTSFFNTLATEPNLRSPSAGTKLLASTWREATSVHHGSQSVNLGVRWGWVIKTTPLLLYTQEWLGTNCIRGHEQTVLNTHCHYIPEKCKLYCINEYNTIFPIWISYIVFYKKTGTASVQHITGKKCKSFIFYI